MESVYSHKKSSSTEKISPGRKQYLEIKSSYQNELLLYRMGDFYETFDDDAITLSSVLGIALTKRDIGSKKKSNLAGIPVHSLENYIKNLLDAGLTIAIAEQTSDPTARKGIVDRSVVRIITPGTVFEPSILDETKNSYVLSLFFNDYEAGISWIDITTGEFRSTKVDLDKVNSEIERLQANEIITYKNDKPLLSKLGIDQIKIKFLDEEKISKIPDQNFLNQFKVDLSDVDCSTFAAYLVYKHVSDTQMGFLPQINALTFENSDGYMILDGRTLEDLEIFDSKGTGKSLFECMNYTNTSMGTRLLRNWLSRPLNNVESINQRLQSVDICIQNYIERTQISDCLKRVSDIERLINRVITNVSNPRDLISLRDSLSVIPSLPNLTSEILETLKIQTKIPDNSRIINLINSSINDNPGNNPGDGNVIRRGFNIELDELSELLNDTGKTIIHMENTIKTQTGIKNLKIGFNRVFGYYLEVTRSQISNVPDYFQPRQSLVNSERYITTELKELENKILHAKDRVSVLEKEVFKSVCKDVSLESNKVLELSIILSHLDVITGIANASIELDWNKPKIDSSYNIKIKLGRHPMVEDSITKGDYVSNDVDITGDNKRINIITGPNMSGKSTYIRQIGVLCIMAQIGSYLPAKSAEIGLVDRIFTRAGLGDDISAGQSTFMVEMLETAEILNFATKKSLAIMDEVGRGTSTYDGLAIARAVVEFLHDSNLHGCRTLFATHFHEMANLSEFLPDVHNLMVSVSEESDGIVFLRTILPGGTNKSYGVHVAKLAGMPNDVIDRSWNILKQLETESNTTIHPLQMQMNFDNKIDKSNELFKEKLLEANLDQMTPIEALNMLNMLKNEIKKDYD
tara:strand:- start:2796 stop:5378 length:2583 start_codon:yes stop_codon:yes gene_type:complete